MGSVNIERYTADTYKRVPSSLYMGSVVVRALFLIRITIKQQAAAYRVAKRGRYKVGKRDLSADTLEGIANVHKTTKDRKRSESPSFPEWCANTGTGRRTD